MAKALRKATLIAKKAKLYAEVQKKLEIWKPYFKLSDWRFKIEITEPNEQGGFANVSVVPRERWVRLQINSADWRTLTEFGKVPSVERIVVHELIHVRLSLLVLTYKDTLSQMAMGADKDIKQQDRLINALTTMISEIEEQVVEDIADAIFRQKERR